MSVNLEAIHFNHDPTSKTTGAFSIRRNETTPVVLPEWRRDRRFTPEDAPTAYIFNMVKELKGIIIKAEFSCTDPAISAVLVRARDGHVDPVNILGTVQPKEVEFVDRNGNATLVLENVRIPDLGVGVGDVIWNWQYSLDGGKTWNDIVTSLHKIYTVVDMPTAPWQPESRDITNTQLPWTEVLDIACRVAVATKTLDEAATKITLWANSLGAGFVQYDNLGNGWQGFTFENPPSFDCSDFLLLLNRLPNQLGSTVNCDDCAAIVTSFSNVLGCRLSEGSMSDTSNFKLKRNRKIGRPAVVNGRFSRHNVGWLGNCTADDPVFDACIQLDFDGTPMRPPLWTVPVNIVFRDYRPRLTLANVVPRGRRQVRRIGVAARHFPPNNFLALTHFALSGAVIPTIPGSFLKWATLLAAEPIQNLELIDFRFIDTTLAEYFLQSFWRRRNPIDVSFDIHMYEVAPGKSTKPLLENILDRFHLRPEKMSDAFFGTEAYASEDRFTIVFVRDPFLFLLRNTGKQVVSTEGLAKLIDRFITG